MPSGPDSAVLRDLMGQAQNHPAPPGGTSPIRGASRRRTSSDRVCASSASNASIRASCGIASKDCSARRLRSLCSDTSAMARSNPVGPAYCGGLGRLSFDMAAPELVDPITVSSRRRCRHARTEPARVCEGAEPVSAKLALKQGGSDVG